MQQHRTRCSARNPGGTEVKPGVTGWAKWTVRNAIRWEQKLDLDMWYVDNWTLWLDLRILVRTLGQRRQGMGHAGSAYARVLGVPARLAAAINDAVSHPERGREMALPGRAMVVEQLEVGMAAAQVLLTCDELGAAAGG